MAAGVKKEWVDGAVVVFQTGVILYPESDFAIPPSEVRIYVHFVERIIRANYGFACAGRGGSTEVIFARGIVVRSGIVRV